MNARAQAFKPLLEALVFALLATALLQQIYDWDIWYHLSIGREIARNLAMPAIEFLVYPNADQSGEYHEWGFGLLFFSTWKLAGFWGISVLNAVIAALTLWFLFRAVDHNPWSSPVNTLVLMLVLTWIQSRLIYRPEMMLYLALAFEIFLLERFCTQKNNWKWLTPIPVLALALSQAHPSIVLMLIVLGAYAIHFAWVDRKHTGNLSRHAGWFFLCGLATAIFSLLNPYGLEQLLLPFTFSQQARVTLDIFEFMPSLDSVDKWHFIALSAIVFVALLVQQNKRPVDWLLFLLFGYLALLHVRNIAVFALVMYVPMARGFSEWVESSIRFAERLNLTSSTQVIRKYLWGLAAVAFVFLLVSKVSDQVWGAGPLPGQYPENSARVIQEIQPPGRIFNSYEFGGYLGWALADDYQVFIDGRHYKMNKALAAYRSIRSTRTGWQVALDSYAINTIVIPPKIIAGKLMPLLAALIVSPEWTLAVAEDGELLFFRSDEVNDLPQSYRLDKQQVWPMIAEAARSKIDDFPDIHMTYVTLADALLHLGEQQQAIEALRDYTALEPADEEIARRLAELESRN